MEFIADARVILVITRAEDKPMTATFAKWFGNGSGHARRYKNSDFILIDWNGHDDGYAFVVDVEKNGKIRAAYRRHNVDYPSMAALFRAIVSEHASC
jgi:hypothetical protein